jgi:hypothetical protein
MRRTGSIISARLALTAALLLLLAACGSVNDPREDKVGNFLVAPGKYRLYDCQQLAQQAASYIGREQELREARARAEGSPGGELVSSLAYGGEYGQVRGNIDELRREVTEKKCDPPPPGLMAGSSLPPPNRPPAR